MIFFVEKATGNRGGVHNLGGALLKLEGAIDYFGWEAMQQDENKEWKRNMQSGKMLNGAEESPYDKWFISKHCRQRGWGVPGHCKMQSFPRRPSSSEQLPVGVTLLIDTPPCRRCASAPARVDEFVQCDR